MNAQTQIPRPPIPILLIAITAFLIPLMGGNLYLGVGELKPGPAAFLAAFIPGPEAPAGAQLVILLPLFLTCLYLVLKRQVLQLPAALIVYPLIGFFSILLLSVMASDYRVISLAALLQWLLYGVAFFAASSGAGRAIGPKIIASSFVTGCSLVAISGIREYATSRAQDPTWRIFADWNNPNALAGILIVGFILALGLAMLYSRLQSMLCGAAACLIGLAIFLTQSRGGFLAVAVGTAFFLFFIFLNHQKEVRSRSLRVVAILVIVLAMASLTLRSMKQADTHQISHLGTASVAASQSTQFRRLLWKGALELVKENPVGSGIGTYEYQSAKTGLTTQTGLAHSSLLQLAVEASPLAALILVAVIVIWYRLLLKGHRKDVGSVILRSSFGGAIAAMLIDGLFESNLYFFGIGITFFLLLGLGMQAAADAVAPEITPKPLRQAFSLATVVLALGLLYNTYVQVLKAEIRYGKATLTRSSNIDSGEQFSREDLHELASSLTTIAPTDGEGHYLAAFDPQSDPTKQLSELRAAVDYEPNSRFFRSYARMLAASGKTADAETVLEHALKADPHNLLDLRDLLQLLQVSDPSQAEATARRMIEVEALPYFQIRSIPEIVPLETVQARIYLASRTNDPKVQAALLEPGLDLESKYATTTVPNIVSAIQKYGPESGIAEENATTAAKHLTDGDGLVKRLDDLYRTTGDAAGLNRVAAEASVLAASRASLEGALGGNR